VVLRRHGIHFRRLEGGNELRRLLVLGVLAFSTLAFAATASGDHGDVAKPLCADIRNADFFYTFTSTVNVRIDTEAPSCRGITYTLYVIVDAGEVVSSSVRGDGTSQLLITSPTFDDANAEVCAYATSSRGGPSGTNQLLDEIGGDGTQCATMAPGGSGGTGFH
jgi:hypothetical protein